MTFADLYSFCDVVAYIEILPWCFPGKQLLLYLFIKQTPTQGNTSFYMLVGKPTSDKPVLVYF